LVAICSVSFLFNIFDIWDDYLVVETRTSWIVSRTSKLKLYRAVY
jgi:hypothetical protein